MSEKSRFEVIDEGCKLYDIYYRSYRSWLERTNEVEADEDKERYLQYAKDDLGKAEVIHALLVAYID